MNRYLHIVCFDVPFPVSHGGYFDLFFKLKALKDAGTSIHLHCFEYGRGEPPALLEYCDEVSYYKRKKLSGISFSLPYIVSTRISSELIEILSRDEHPILLEGTHTTYLLFENLFPRRRILYRLHNIEHIYYRHLYEAEKTAFKKIYFSLESKSLKKYEAIVIPRASQVLTVSEKDRDLCRVLYPEAKVTYLPLFLPYNGLRSKTGRGGFILYHGNLAISENEKAAFHLLDVVKNTGFPMVIAGRNPSDILLASVLRLENVTVRKDLSDEEMEELIQAAHINVIYNFNATGIKVKLLHALYSGRHCLVNEAAVPGPLFLPFCHVANSADDLRSMLSKLMETDFTAGEAEKRKTFLQEHFNSARNAERINAFLQ